MNGIKRLVIRILTLFPTGKYIVFESVPDLSDNPKPVFDKMLEMKLEKKYKFVWYVSDKTKDSPWKDKVICVDTNGFFHKQQFRYYMLRAKCLISCNQFLPSMMSKQKSFYLTHGTALKSVRSYYTVPANIDYMLVASEGVKDMMAYELNFDIKKTIALGYPRNDVLTNAKVNLHHYFNVNFNKIVVWYPTFRQHKNGKKTGSKNALPILNSTAAAIELNEIAQKAGVLIVMKPHFAQDISYIKDNNLSNIRFITDEFFVENEISSYEFIAGCDAMITDYSSVYFDYLLCDKPVALMWEDIEDYRKDPGIAVDVDYIGKGAEKIYNLTDFENFIVKVSEGIDNLRNERHEICEWANYAADGMNTERVVDFIIEKANL